jgi:recombination protein RecA
MEESSVLEENPKQIQQFKKLLEAEDNIFGTTLYYLHSGNLALDYIISGKADGTGGWPGGKVVEMFGAPSCLVAGTKICLANGSMVPIESLGHNHLDNINIDILLDKYGNKANAKIFHKFDNQNIVEILMQGGTIIKGTYNHPLLKVMDDYSFVWTTLDKLKIGDKLATITYIPCSIVEEINTDFHYLPISKYSPKYKYNIPEKVTEELAAIFGYIIGDGWIQKDKKYGYGFRRVAFLVNESEQDILPILLKYVENTFGCPPRISVREPDTTPRLMKSGKYIVGKQTLTDVTYSSVPMATILSFLINKEVPDLIFRSGNKVVASFIRWLFEADGHVDDPTNYTSQSTPGIGLTSNYPQLLQDIKLLLLRFKIRSRIYNNKLYISDGQSIIYYAQHIGFVSNKKKNRLIHLMSVRQDRRKQTYSDYEIIKDIKYLNDKESVYDIEVLYEHSFIANGVISHNTGKTLLIDKAGAEMQKIGGVFVLADVENRWNKAFAKMHGVNVDNVICFSPSTVEEFTIKIDRLLEAAEDTKFLIALDSLARLSTIKEVDDVGDGDIKADQGRKAQKIHAAMRVLPAKISKTNSIFMVANHIIDNPNQMYSSIKHTPGGRGIPFQATVRVDLSSPTTIVLKGRNRPIGVELHAKCVKNSETVPFGECDIKMLWSIGISKYAGLADILVDCGIINKNGAWLEFQGQKFYERDISKIIESHPEILTDKQLTNPYFMREE